jgi:hypothetical protein
MMELAYRYDRDHLKAYQALASCRVEARDRDYASEWWGWMLGYALAAGAGLAVADLAFPVLTGRPFCALEFIGGFVTGWACIYALSWRRYRRLSAAMVKADGPTMSEQRITVAADGIKSTSRFIDHLYRWTAFEEVTVYDGIIVLWTEPGDGAMVPRSAFADPASEAAFLEAVRANMTTAKAGRP